MSESLILNAQVRDEAGTRESRRIRRAGGVPAIIYGAKKPAQAITLRHNEVIKTLNHESAYSQVLTLKVANTEEAVIIKTIERHVYKPLINHIDFLRVDMKIALTKAIPLHFINEDTAPGVKAGGAVNKVITEVEVKCLPSDLPEFIAVDLENLEMDQTIHLSELQMPQGVALAAAHLDSEHDQPVVAIHMPRVARVEEAEAAEAVEEAAETAEQTKAESSENEG